MTFMDDREKNILEAAIRVISRYGVKRTSMNDIACEAGIVRQTLYTVYASKDEVLRATIRFLADRSLAAIEADGVDALPLGDKLDILFEHMAVRPFDMLNATPDADDIISGFNDAARDEISKAAERHRLAIEQVLAPHDPRVCAAGLTTHQLSDFIQRALVAFKHDARDKMHLLDLLKSLKLLVLRVSDGA